MITWKDITVKQYIQITSLGEFNIDDLGVVMELITIVYGKSWEEVENLPINEGAKLRGEIINLFNKPLNQENYLEEFYLDGYDFKFADLQNDWSFAKNIDLQHYAPDPKNFGICLAILYYPPNIKYETKKALELAKIIENWNIDDLYGAWWFFFLFSTASAKLTGNYSVLDLMTEMTKILMKAGQDPEKLLPILKRILLRKLKKSGLTSELLITSQAEGLINGNMF